MFDRIVAVVDHDPILLSELDRATHPFLVVMEAQIPDATKREEARLGIFKETLDKLIDRRLVERAALKKGMRVSETEIDQGIESIAKQNNITTAAVSAEVARTGMTEKEYRAEIAYQVLEGRMVFLLVQGKIDTSDPAPSARETAQKKLAKIRNEWIAKLRAEAFIEVRM